MRSFSEFDASNMIFFVSVLWLLPWIMSHLNLEWWFKALCRYSVLHVIILECFLSSVNSNLLMCWFLVSYLLGRLLLPQINLHFFNFIIYATVVYVLRTRYVQQLYIVMRSPLLYLKRSFSN